MKRRKFLKTCLAATAGFSFEKPWKEHPSLKPQDERTPKLDDGMIVKVLGTAQDGGLPQIGCSCRNCRHARKEPGFARLISALALIDPQDKKYFLVDATPDIRAQVDMVHTRIGSESSTTAGCPQGILLTHAHIGHYTGLMFFGYESMGAQNLPVYCSHSMTHFLSKNGPWDQLVKLKNISLRLLTPGKQQRLTSRLHITPFLVPHRDEYTDTLGFIIKGPNKKLLYIPDIQNWGKWDRSIKEEVKKVDYALLDGTFFSPDELPGRDLDEIGHPFISDSMQILSSSDKQERNKVFFTHLNHSNPALDPEGQTYQAIKDQGFHLAEDGAEFSLD